MRFRRTLIAAMVSFTVLAGTGAAAAGAAVSDEQIAITTPPAGSKAWTQDHSLGRDLPNPAKATAAQVAAFFATLTTAQQQRLVHAYPLVVGNFDGAPLALRYQANAIAMEQELATQKARAADTSLSAGDRATAAGRAGILNTLLTPGRQILAFDPRGRGLVAEVFGNLSTAQRVSVVVPGSDMDLAHFVRTDQPLKGAAGMAEALRAEEAKVSPDTSTAVIAWSGYVTPVGLGADAATARLAEAAARNPGDWIGNVPYLEVAGLGHGADPTSTDFGSRVIASTGASGHNGYLSAGTASLRNFADIALDRYADVVCSNNNGGCISGL